jgi:hypothetical protein
MLYAEHYLTDTTDQLIKILDEGILYLHSVVIYANSLKYQNCLHALSGIAFLSYQIGYYEFPFLSIGIALHKIFSLLLLNRMIYFIPQKSLLTD